ncbi:MAG: CRISPR-associated endonuclease Cas1 [Acidobacteriota bacterium]
MKALYLEGGDGLEVRLDGPALRVRRPARADGHYPLARVARVIAVGAVRWQPEALVACLREHKPVAVLDRRGRFVRVLFRTPGSLGLARHLGELLAVPRFRMRYTRWRRETERCEMQAAVRHLGICCVERRQENVWQQICREQCRRWGIRPGGSYRYLLGLAAAQIAAALASIGMPRHPETWQRQEYRLFSHLLRLERWWQARLLEDVLARRAGVPSRRELTAAFEGGSDQRERRLTEWRRQALLAVMGLSPRQTEVGPLQPDGQTEPLAFPATVARLCAAAGQPTGNRWRVPLGARGSLRTSVRIVRAYLEYDRRTCESYRIP